MVNILVLAILLAFGFKFSWVAVRIALKISLNLIKVGMVIVVLVAISCNPYTFRSLGWTPISVMFGDKVYDKALKQMAKRESNGQNQR